MVLERGWRAFFGLGAFLMVLATLGVPAALGASPSFQFDPPVYGFGPVPYAAGPSEPHEFTLTNTTETQLAIKRWRTQWGSFWPDTPDPFQVTSSNCGTLEPHQSCSIEIVFDPLHPGPWHGLQMAKSQIEEPWAELELTGEGTGPWVPVTPDRLVFESVPVGTTSPPQTITLESQGYADFALEAISLFPVDSSAPFQVVGGSCHPGASLEPGKTCTIEVVMKPTDPGSFQATLAVADTAPDSPQSIEVKGTATAPSLDQPLTFQPAATPPAHLRRACPKGKRKVVRNGRRLCVKRHRHRQHRARPAKQR